MLSCHELPMFLDVAVLNDQLGASSRRYGLLQPGKNVVQFLLEQLTIAIHCLTHFHVQNRSDLFTCFQNLI
jgi:hypothetical protein